MMKRVSLAPDCKQIIFPCCNNILLEKPTLNEASLGLKKKRECPQEIGKQCEINSLSGGHSTTELYFT